MQTQTTNDPETPKNLWHQPKLIVLGKFSEIVQQGGGKLSNTTGDPGEPRKVPAQG